VSRVIPPTILACVDARLDPAKDMGLSEGNAHVLRNAGGRARDDALRSLIISYKLEELCGRDLRARTTATASAFTARAPRAPQKYAHTRS
jgi:hypothetical protein